MEDCSEDWNRRGIFERARVRPSERRSSKLASEVGLAGILRHEIARDTGEETPSSPPWLSELPGQHPLLTSLGTYLSLSQEQD